MKKVIKEFWVSDTVLGLLNGEYGVVFSDAKFSNNEFGSFKNKITITFEIPDRKIEISEIEFDEAVEGIGHFNTIQELKRKLFGGER